MIHVATAYWCYEEHWVIAAGSDRDAVVRDAEAYMAKHKHVSFNEAGGFKNPDPQGRCAEGYNIESVDESK